MRFKNIVESLQNYFSLHDYLIPQSEAEESIREGVTFRGTNMLILIMAILIASLGLNTNSTAVIIGAMLISPLMGPIIGLGLAIGIEDFNLLKRSAKNLFAAAVFSIIASTIYFLISPVAEGHSELLARTSPTIYDVLIGFFGGGAGIIGLCSRSKGNVIPGVAIATALMPPLCTVGYGVATFQPHYFLGALYLFLINSVFIATATFIGVKSMGYKPVKFSNPERAKKVQHLVYAIAILTLLPSVYLTYNMIRENNYSLNVQRFINNECHWPETRVISSSIDWHSRRPSDLSLTLVGHIMPRDSLIKALSSRLSYYGLEGTKINILQGDMAIQHIEKDKSKEMYEVSQQLIASKQASIDSLRKLIADSGFGETSEELLPEVRVVFPMVDGLALAKPDMAKEITKDSISESATPIAIVRTSTRLKAAEHTRLQEYLRKRLNSETLHLLELSR